MMAEDTSNESKAHAAVILVALLLFLLGDRSLELARIGAHLFDKITGFPSAERFTFEISLFGVAFGASAVVVLSVVLKKLSRRDNSTILIGITTATFASLIDILDAALGPDSAKFGDIPSKALFFYMIWLVLFILPLFARALERSAVDFQELNVLAMTAAALIASVPLGIMVRSGASATILFAFDIQGVESMGSALDQMRYNPDTLVMLGSVWSVAAFMPFRSDRRWWRSAYILAAPVAGWTYGVIFQNSVGSASSFLQFGGYALLSLAAIAPGIFFADQVLNRDPWAAGSCAVANFGTCFLAMALWVVTTSQTPTELLLTLAIFQGLAGASIPVAVYCAACIIERLGQE